MKLQILQVKTVSKGRRFAHVQLGDLFGDLPAGECVEPGQPARLTNTFRVINGELRASIKVERA